MFLTEREGLWVLAIFSIAMIVAVALFSRRTSRTLVSFILADRSLGSISGGFSLAVTFIWAPAIFVSAMQSFNEGVPGIFWFTVPNVLCLLVSAWVAPRIRARHEEGFTFAQYIADRLGRSGWHAHLSLLTINYLWMVLAVIFNATAGGLLLETISGVPFEVTAPAMVILALAYSVASGLRASVITDVIQMSVIILFVAVFVPVTVGEIGTLEPIAAGLGGWNEQGQNPLTLSSFWYLGLLPFIGLWGGWIQDPTFYQRVFAMKPRSIRPAFFVAASAFVVVPLTLSILGFAGAGLATAVLDETGNPTSWILQQNGTTLATVTDPQMIGPIMIGTFLPKIGLLCFTFMAFAALCSTLDSAFVATGALTSVDIYSRYFRPDAPETRTLIAGRSSMIVVAVLGLLVSFSRPSLFWLFLTISAVAVGGIVPTLMLIFRSPPRARAITISVWASLLISLPTAIYANNNESPDVQIVGTLVALAFSTVLCLRDRVPENGIPAKT